MIIGLSKKPIGRGGAISWISAFSKYCINSGHQVKYDYTEDIDVFCSVANFNTPEELKYLKDKNIRILQRVGAIFLDYNYDRKSIIKEGNNKLRRLISYADHLVYQSKFSKNVLFGSLYNGKEPDGDIIYNCTNSKMFHPNVRTLRKRNGKKTILTSAYWGSPKTALDSIKLLIETARRLLCHPEIEFWVMGLAYPEVDAYIRKANLCNITKLNILQPLPRKIMPNYIKTADMVLHLKAHEGCSNAVIETMNVGTPLVGLQSGSLPELLGNAALLAECTSDIRQFPKVSIDDLVNKILLTLDSADEYGSRMQKRATLYTEENQFNQYITILENLYHNS
ncbi:hypothetical protein SH1V18_33040 [Vallitalea longa]|uniref:Glycosyl transferase family 1 domain-containing protein n=1 Tax=Vallitalea longa TaxID=2936439 RepID=A0A9W5YD13_9FIRM|nr:glycosyltransferase [Vallitalea longa]GKX30824.1 hypothetical protein SH1V18_33040 [Vallitalea longa]